MDSRFSVPGGPRVSDADGVASLTLAFRDEFSGIRVFLPPVMTYDMARGVGQGVLAAARPIGQQFMRYHVLIDDKGLQIVFSNINPRFGRAGVRKVVQAVLDACFACD